MTEPQDFLKSYILESGKTYIQASEVVEMAFDPDCPLHSYFEWDDGAAAHQYRLSQARQLIRSITITTNHAPDVPIRLMVSVPEDRGVNGYQLLTEAMKNPAARESLLAEITAKIAYWKGQAALLDGRTLKWLDRYPGVEKKDRRIVSLRKTATVARAARPMAAVT